MRLLSGEEVDAGLGAREGEPDKGVEWLIDSDEGQGYIGANENLPGMPASARSEQAGVPVLRP
jgi:hypothetical protein